MDISIFDNEPGGRDYAAGETIFNAGDEARALFAVQSGEVDLFVGDLLVETVAQGGVFGEMGMIEKAPRTATAIARTACRVVEVDEFGFVRQVTRNPFFALEMMRVLAHRLRNADAQIAASH